MTFPPDPFKGLARFEDTDVDAALFFGRERDREIVAANLVASRLTVLYGASGVGKSSLLRAGVAHQLRHSPDPSIVVVFDAWQSEPVTRLRQALADAAGIEPAPTLADTLDACATVVDGHVFVLLDQVDEYFLYHRREAGAGALTDELPTALAAPGVRASFLLALREETLAKLDAFKGRIPNLFGNYLRLEHLDRAAGRAAILGPIDYVNREAREEDRLGIEPDLVEAVLDEVAAGTLDLAQAGRGRVSGSSADGRIETPYLQLVMQRLWAAEREAGSRTLRLATLRDLGGAEQIVRDRLQGALDALAPGDQDVTAAVFNHLVTPSGTKIAHGTRDLAEYAHVDEAELAPVLSRLAAERILRPVADESGGERYEIFHDVLADAALAWKRRHDADRELEREREHAGRRHRRLVAALVAAGLLLAVMAGVTVFALTQRSHARSQARLAHARELIAVSLSNLSTDPAASLRDAVKAARLSPGDASESALRQALLAFHERAVLSADGPLVLAKYSPDGSRILTAGADGRARLYDARTHRLLGTLRHGASVTDAAFSPDGLIVFTAGEDGAVRVWRTFDARLVRTLRHGPPVRSLAVARDGTLVAVAGGRAATLWRGPDGTGIARLHTPRPLTIAALGPGGRLLAVAGPDRRALVYSTSDGHLLRRLDQGASVTSLAFLPGGRELVAGGKNGKAVIWQVATGKRLRELAAGRGTVLDLAVSPHGALVGAASSDGLVRIWDVRTGGLVSILAGHTNPVTGLAFSPDGALAVTSSSDKTARIWKVDSGDERAVLAGNPEAVTAASFSPDGKAVLTAGADGTVRLWDPEEQPRLTLLTRESTPRAEYVRDGVVLVAGSRGARLVRVPDGATVRRLALGPVSATAVGADGSRIALASGQEVVVYDGSEGSVTARLPQPAAVKAVALSPDRKELAVAGADGVARVVTLDGTLVRELRSRAGLTDVAYSPDGARLATASQDGTVRVWDVRTGAVEHVLRGHRGEVTSVAFSPDGRLVLTAGRDGDGRLWDAETGKPLQLLRWHFGAVSDASFSPDGRWIVTAGPATAQLWQPGVESPLLPFGLAGHVKPLTSAGFDPTGRVVLTASRDGTVRTYRCTLCGSLDDLLAVATRRLASTSGA